jgi:DNA repair photolyase
MDWRTYGIAPGKCIDADYIHATFGIEVTRVKDPSQRAACGCVISKDIGAYDTCGFGCQYCYATTNFARAQNRRTRHDPDAPALI